jgi:hypothetical protein
MQIYDQKPVLPKLFAKKLKFLLKKEMAAL